MQALATPAGLRDPLSSAVLGGSEGQDSGAGLPGFKSKVTWWLVKVTQWPGTFGQVTSFPNLGSEGSNCTYIPGLYAEP